ncbi:MAG: DUF6522 family protein [Sulfitobacter sp.]
MKIDLTQPNPTIDAADLAKALELNAPDVKSLMRDGQITSQFETGIDENAGSHRLTFWYGDIKVRFTCDEYGLVVKTSRIKAKRQK